MQVQGMAGPSAAVLEILDLSGRVVKRAALKGRAFVWNASDGSNRKVANGLYMVRLKTSNRIFTRRLMVLK
jgi:hypothetical protein